MRMTVIDRQDENYYSSSQIYACMMTYFGVTSVTVPSIEA